MDVVVLGLVLLPWLAVAVGCWIGYQLVRQNGRILLHLEAVEARLAQFAGPAVSSEPPGLPVGSEAPIFALPDLHGRRVTLDQFRGRRVLLVFFSPSCGFCQQMAGDLAALPLEGERGRPLPVVVTTGDVEANRHLAHQHMIRCPLLYDARAETAARYQATGTPMGYLLDEQGRIASRLAAGAESLLDLAVSTEQLVAGRPEPSTNGRHSNGQPLLGSLEKSRLQRDGLAAGTAAPGFRLARIDGGELALEDLRGGRVLLVFSDPGCGPCNELAPRLERLHQEQQDLQLVLISRGNPDANRAKAAEHGLSFPVVLQHHWEISRAYGMFATPIGYLIDERGIIASDVAVGQDAILALAAAGAATDSA